MTSQKDLVETSLKRLTLKIAMLRDAQLIIDSVDFLERQIQRVSTEIDAAQIDFNDEEEDRLRDKLLHLLGKLKQETSHMDTYMEKYQKLVHNEEKTMLFS